MSLSLIVVTILTLIFLFVQDRKMSLLCCPIPLIEHWCHVFAGDPQTLLPEANRDHVSV